MSASDTADRLWSEIVRARDQRCQECGLAGRRNHQGLFVVGLEAAHLIPRRHGHTRTDIDNGVALCHDCHSFFTGQPKATWMAWVADHVDRDTVRRLVELAKRTDHVDWSARVDELKPIHERMLAAA